MKNYIILIAAALTSAAFLTSCTKEQSTLTLDKIDGSATVTGTFTYDAGATRSAGSDGTEVIIDSHFVPAANQQVFVTVQNSEYISGQSGASGYQTFSGTTDQDGNFSITVPVGYTTISATVSAPSFIASKTVNVNGELIAVPNALYNSNTVHLTLANHYIYQSNLQATSTTDPSNNL